MNGVEGLDPGTYRHLALRGWVEQTRTGNFRAKAQRLAFDQSYAADAHVNAYYLTHLDPVLERYGNRGYRLAQLEPAIYAGKLHLGTHALGLGAVGSTSFDDDVVEFFSPQASGSSYMFMVVFGKRRRTPVRVDGMYAGALPPGQPSPPAPLPSERARGDERFASETVNAQSISGC